MNPLKYSVLFIAALTIELKRTLLLGPTLAEFGGSFLVTS
jgi:hypothetical protein